MDDAPDVLRNVARLLDRASVTVRASTSLGEARRVLLAGAVVDGALVDRQLADGSGLELMEELRVTDPAVPLGLMSGYAMDDALNHASRLDASVYRKPFRFAALRPFVRRAWLHRLGRSSLLDLLEDSWRLTPRERTCLEQHTLRGLTYARVAEACGISVPTAKTYVQRALIKLDCGSGADLRRELRQARERLLEAIDDAPA
ncbi:MAG TPA: sigma factor-like helix-turn-helix DNA-binding protein [Sandaracinaceae bacterium LLY-WYZ-13_1]|nr:sigma factor-like helix-turn-helix DNA-binding protein [Sandaracinaceae bacterium LLY-WYZ-13_1]